MFAFEILCRPTNGSSVVVTIASMCAERTIVACSASVIPFVRTGASFTKPSNYGIAIAVIGHFPIISGFPTNHRLCNSAIATVLWKRPLLSLLSLSYADLLPGDDNVDERLYTEKVVEWPGPLVDCELDGFMGFFTVWLQRKTPNNTSITLANYCMLLATIWLSSAFSRDWYQFQQSFRIFTRPICTPGIRSSSLFRYVIIYVCNRAAYSQNFLLWHLTEMAIQSIVHMQYMYDAQYLEWIQQSRSLTRTV